MNVGCVILAGGKSSRMGTDKALLEYDGKQFIEQIAKELSSFEERIIARGTNSRFSDSIEEEWIVIPDIYQDHGPIGGLHAALSACKSDALFVVTCDMPLFSKALAERLCAEMKTGEGSETNSDGEYVDAYDVVISVGDNGKIHPLCGVYRKSALSVLEEQIVSDRNRVMEALKKLRVKYVTIDSPDQVRQLANINTPEEYETLKHL
ncbi:MAG: molybdenum cofactor guanylyltransferase [Lachnospiraceae bacterium]|nr:molybdenum cofactor guanylyltransferase [Lachnospiraceae bacterium]